MKFKFDSIQLFAELSAGVWTDISADWDQNSPTVASLGIRGKGPVDILASPASFRFTLNNSSYKYYPDGDSPLAGWGIGTRIKIVTTYKDGGRVKFFGYIPVNGMQFPPAKIQNEERCNVTALTWIGYAADNPIDTPDVTANTSSGNAVRAVLAKMAVQPPDMDIAFGDYVFPAVFDSTGRRTTALAEFGKIVTSESLGRIYERCNGTLVFENATKRSSTDPQTIIVDSANLGDVLLLTTGDRLLLAAGGGLLLNPTKNADFTTAIDASPPTYGDGIFNRVLWTAHPKRIDIEPHVLYSLDTPLLIPASGTVEFYAPYTDQVTGREISAIASSMITPEAPGDTDPYLMTALSFNSVTGSPGTTPDSTGRHTWTMHHSADMIVEDEHTDGYGIMRIAANVIGPFAILGGFSDYRITAPSSADFNFGAGAWTIGWYEARINIVDAQSIMARHAGSYPPFLFGKFDASSKELKCYMSSNGSSWDVADGVSMGRVKASRWTHYEISHDEDGWYRIFNQGALVSKWWSDLALPDSALPFSIGLTETTQYVYAGIDEFYIRKGQCLHKENFTPPELEVSPTLSGDYLINTVDDGSGTDISDDLTITATYDSAGVRYSLTNGNASDGYLWYLTARGLGIYPYNPIDDVIEDATSIAANGYKTIDLRQQYQQNLDAGRVVSTDIVANYKDAATRIPYVAIYANYSADNMHLFQTLDVGSLVRVTHAPSGVTLAYYYIQSIDYDIRPGQIVRVVYGLQPDFEHS